MGASAQYCAMLFYCPVIWMDVAESSNRGRGQLYYVLHSACALTPSALHSVSVSRHTQPFCFPRQTDRQTKRQTGRQKCSLFPWGLHWSCQSLHLLPYQCRLPPLSPSVQTPIDWRAAECTFDWKCVNAGKHTQIKTKTHRPGDSTNVQPQMDSR